ncbi:MAG: RrF2 family transcriptional regulator [Lachnospiraceae bacterium]
MRISVKGRYGLAAMINMASNYDIGEYITVISISEKLGISKIYLEQVFSLLKRGGLVNSIKGAQGGYRLSRMPRQITVFDVINAVEPSLFEKTEETVVDKAPEIERAMQLSAFSILDEAVKDTLEKITLESLLTAIEKHKSNGEFMFYI